MNLIEKLIKAKGLSKRQLARELEVGYHSLQKMLKGNWKYTTKTGEVRFTECRHIRKRVADWLGYPYELIWGSNSDVFLKHLITEEIDHQAHRHAELERQELRQALGI